jgi:multisubunit Na+/H+ antiporter MnhE subunit
MTYAKNKTPGLIWVEIPRKKKTHWVNISEQKSNKRPMAGTITKETKREDHK